jgi:CRP-like cAMP-binding protein
MHALQTVPPPQPRGLASPLAGNLLLAQLPDESLERLLPHFSLVELPAGLSLVQPRARCTRAVFPLTGVLALVQEMQDGAGVQVGVVGREGLWGLPLVMGGGPLPLRVTVQCAGRGVALEREPLLAEFERAGSFMRAVLRYAQSFLAQCSQLALCHRHHSIDQQVSRVLLMSLDRLPAQEIPLTQEAIARLLGVRREGVTEAAGRLREAGAVACRRGLFEVRDRAALEARACGCYGMLKDDAPALPLTERGRFARPVTTERWQRSAGSAV